MPDELNSRMVSGLSWSAISQIVTQALNFVIGVVLARLLTPKEFGLMGMAILFIGFATIFRDFGLGAALIQRKDANQKCYTSVFWINIALGILLMLILAICAPWIAKFYKEPILGPITTLLSLNFLAGSFTIVHRTLFQKKLDFKSLAIVEIVTILLSGAIAITMALIGFGVWSLAVHAVVATLTSTLIVWRISDWRPSFLFDWNSVKDLLYFSSNLLGFTLFNHCFRNADNLLIGRVLGSSALGLYSKAYSIMLLPLSNISSIIGRVMFPALSSIQEDKARIRRIYLRATRNIALVSFPLMAGLLVVSKSFVLALFGAQWSGMIPILKIFCIIGMLQSIVTLNGNLYLSQGRANLQFKIGAIISLLGVGSIIIGLKWGVLGVAYAYALFSLFATYPSIRIAVSLVELSVREVVVNLSGVFCCTVVMAVSVWLLGLSLPNDRLDLIALALQVPFGILVYIFLIHFFKLRAYIETIELLKEQWHNRFNRKKLNPIV